MCYLLLAGFRYFSNKYSSYPLEVKQPNVKANVSNYSSNKSSNCLMENFENLMESNFPFVLTIKLVWSKTFLLRFSIEFHQKKDWEELIP